MKILLTTHQFLPDFTSGTEVLSFEVARELSALGHDVRILTGWPPDPAQPPDVERDEYWYEGIRVHRLYCPPVATTTAADRTRAEFDNPATAAAFAAITAAWRPDVVHFFHLQRLSASVPVRCEQEGIASVYTVTDFWPICPLNQLRLPDGETCSGPSADSANCVLHLAVQNRMARLAPVYNWIPDRLVGTILRIVARDEASESQNIAAARALQRRPETTRRMLGVIDRIVAPTAFMARRLVEFGAPAEAVRLLGYGIATKTYADPSPLLTGTKLRVGFIGTLHEHKGAHVLIDAVKLLDPAMSCEVSIYGDETFYPLYVAELRASAAHEPRVSFRGTFVRDDLPRVVNEFDLLVVPSTWSENTPLVIFAAQTAGRPVVGSDVEGIAEVITDGANGRLFPPGDAVSLAAILVEVAENPDELLRMARQATKAKDISLYVGELLSLYDEALAERALARAHVTLKRAAS